MSRPYCLLALLILIYHPASAQDRGDLWSLNLFLENDLFANTDLNYTNGARFSLVSPDLESFTDQRGDSYRWVDWLKGWTAPIQPRPSGDGPVYHNITASAGQLIFTPADRYRTDIDPQDRPYAGWLYMGLGLHARTSRRLHSLEVNLGVVGPAAQAQEAQDFFHQLWNIDTFEGWHNQLRNEIGLQLVFERKTRSKTLFLNVLHGLQADAIGHWGASLGNIATFANAGVELRLGWNLPKDFGASTLRPGGDNHAPGMMDLEPRPWRFHLFAASDFRLVGRHIFLDGNTFKSSHAVDKEPLVADLALGLSAAYKRWRLTYAHIYRSKEFKTQRQAQFYGSLSLSFSFQHQF